jgi:hypothetical protein
VFRDILLQGQKNTVQRSNDEAVCRHRDQKYRDKTFRDQVPGIQTSVSLKTDNKLEKTTFKKINGTKC